MKSKLLAKRRLRSPLVVTLAAATSFLPACGGKALVTIGDGGNPPPDSQCPSELPASGSICAGSASCNYSMGAPCGETLAECVNGAWQIAESTCNPPPPPTPTCPPTEPAVGSTCPGPFGYSCAFVDGCTGMGNATLTCDGGTWANSGPPIACPVAQPTSGGSCGACLGRVPSSCSYGDCAGSPNTLAVCNAQTGLWQVSVGTCNPPPIDAGIPDAAAE